MYKILSKSKYLVVGVRYFSKKLSSKAQLSSVKSKKGLEDLLLKMDTKAAHVPAMKAARKAKMLSTPQYPAGVITLMVLGSGAKGAPSSLYIFADQTRYLFNCGEGTQRLAHEHKMKLGKLEHVFITSRQWSKIGGLPGMALTTQDIGVPVLTLHGPPGLEQLFSATSRFVVLKELHVRAADCIENECYENHIMRVDYVPIYPDSEVSVSPNGGSAEEALLEVEDSNVDYYPSPDGSKRRIEVSREDASKKRKAESTSAPTQGKTGDQYETPIRCAMCFICRPKAKEGTLLIDKCVEKGVPPGPLLGQLKSGKDVTLPNGTVVLAKDVRSPDCIGPVFIVADCPSLEYIDSLVVNPVWKKYQSSAQEEDIPHIIVHFTPEKVLLDPRYQAWMEQFSTTTKHLLLNDSCQCIGSEAVLRLQHKLSSFDENIFPALYKGGERERHPAFHQDELGNWIRHNSSQKAVTFVSEPSLPPKLRELKTPVVLGETLMKYRIRPHQGFDNSTIVSYSEEDFSKEAEVSEGFPEELTALREKLRVFADAHQAEYPKILFLGTGSSIPNKGRNVSGIQLHINESTRMILDCGEGTFGQLFRIHGPSKIDQVLTELKAIYISHLHADHHLGLINILKARAEAFDALNIPFKPVILFAPHQILFWLRIFHKNFEKIRPLYFLVPNLTLTSDYEGPYAVENLEEILDDLDLQKMETCGVRHCANSFGVALTHKSGWKISYSGDTMPCDYFIRIGMDSDVCIHEATMEDDLVREAALKQHSTVSQAIEVGNKMNAKFILLTHFSQRYAKVPKIDGNLAPNVGIAFDNMQVRLTDLPKIPFMYPAFKSLFQEDYEEMENKTKKKLAQRERDAVKVAARAAAIANADN